VDKTTKINIASNFLGNGVSAVLGIVFVPTYIKYIGTEGYGLMGLFATVQSVFYLLDMGLSTTLNRDLARLSTDSLGNEVEMRDTTRSYEVAYWGLSILGLIAAIIISYFLAHFWVLPTHFSRDNIFLYFTLLSISFSLFLPRGLYAGGLLGIQQHLAMNIATVAGAVVRYIGAILVLHFIEPTARAFFVWQIFASLFQTVSMAVVLWYYLPNGFFKARFSMKILREGKKFALGLSGISLTALVLTQMDKVVLSRILTLEDLGYYNFASVIGLGLFQLIAPIFQTYFPRISQDFASGDTQKLTETYHQASKIMAIALLPLAATIAFFSKPIIQIWTHNAVLVENSYAIAAILTIGTALNGLVNMPYTLSVAGGRPDLAVKTNIVLILILLPLTIFGAKWYGGVGASMGWLVLNVLYILFFINIVHKQFLKGEKTAWFLKDTLPVFIVSLLIGGIGFIIFSKMIPNFWMLFAIGCTFGLAVLGSLMMVFPKLRSFKLKY
jgi:O-antigen/teichoic acid export membrane protein